MQTPNTGHLLLRIGDFPSIDTLLGLEGSWFFPKTQFTKARPTKRKLIFRPITFRLAYYSRVRL